MLLLSLVAVLGLSLVGCGEEEKISTQRGMGGAPSKPINNDTKAGGGAAGGGSRRSTGGGGWHAGGDCSAGKGRQTPFRILRKWR